MELIGTGVAEPPLQRQAANLPEPYIRSCSKRDKPATSRALAPHAAHELPADVRLGRGHRGGGGCRSARRLRFTDQAHLQPGVQFQHIALREILLK